MSRHVATRSFLVPAIACLLAVTTATCAACSNERAQGRPTTVEEDRLAIAALNERDVQAVLTSDTAALIAQWSDDFVVIPQVGPTTRGRQANAAALQAATTAQASAFVPVSYVVNFEEISVSGDYAFEWGTYRGAVRPRTGGNELTYSGKILRILQRQPDGSWKMHRTMTTTNSPS